MQSIVPLYSLKFFKLIQTVTMAKTRSKPRSLPSQKAQAFHVARQAARESSSGSSQSPWSSSASSALSDSLKAEVSLSKDQKDSGVTKPQHSHQSSSAYVFDMTEARDQRPINASGGHWSCCKCDAENSTSVVWCFQCGHYTVGCLDCFSY